MVMDYQDFCRTGIEFGDLNTLQELCDKLKGQRVVLILTETAVKRYQIQDFVERMQTNCELLWIKENVAYPNQKTLLKGLNKIRDFDTDVMLAIGGGSSIDFAKGLKAFYGLKEKAVLETITEYLQEKKRDMGKKEIHFIAIPTTAGTGAEVTQWATIWDYQKKCKYSIDSLELKPDKAVVISEFTLMADEKLTIATGLDTLAHAVEAYWSKKTNLLVRSIAREAIRISVENLPKILQEPKELLYREKQCLASVLSGLTFSMTRTTACHSISYPLTMDYGILHGIAAAMTLSEVAERNSGYYPEEEELMEIFRGFGGIRGYLQMVCQDRVSLYLKDYGIRKKDISAIAEKSFTLGRMNNNPVDLSASDVEKILQNIYCVSSAW